MNNKSNGKSWLAIIAACLVIVGPARAQTVTIYNNGPINGTIGAWVISPEAAVCDSFTVSSPATLTSAQVGLWVDNGATPVSLQWSIGTTPFASNVSSGTASLNNTLFGPAGISGYSLFESDFAINGSMATGTYYFTLDNAAASDSREVGWDQDNGPSSYYQTIDGSADNIAGSESFQLFSAPVPEPSSVAILTVLTAMGILSLKLRRVQASIPT